MVRMDKVCVLGIGNIGLPVAKHISKHYPVISYDISQKVVDRAVNNGL
ncbi:MAG: hypothetical protein QG670_670 [Thermoproteota archaeon]|nr:hypothetical protein [Thermoproteota archaeon]